MKPPALAAMLLLGVTPCVAGPLSRDDAARLLGAALAQTRSPVRYPLIIHNIGRGPEVEDILFAFPVTGHYRYGRSAGR